jgi:hypothetical protein
MGHLCHGIMTREFFCDSVVTLIQRPDEPEMVYIHIIHPQPKRDSDSSLNQRFSFPLDEILDVLVPLLKNLEGKWDMQHKQLAAEQVGFLSAPTLVAADYGFTCPPRFMSVVCLFVSYFGN